MMMGMCKSGRISLAVCLLLLWLLSPACKAAVSENPSSVLPPEPAVNLSPASNRTGVPETPAAPGYFEVIVGRKEFNPAVITVPVGSTVAWVNKNDEPHMIVSDNGVLNGNLPVGETWSYVFTKPGTYSYSCSYWTEMGGTIYVK